MAAHYRGRRRISTKCESFVCDEAAVENALYYVCNHVKYTRQSFTKLQVTHVYLYYHSTKNCEHTYVQYELLNLLNYKTSLLNVVQFG